MNLEESANLEECASLEGQAHREECAYLEEQSLRYEASEECETFGFAQSTCLSPTYTAFRKCAPLKRGSPGDSASLA